MVQTAVVAEANVTAKPDEAVALTVNGAAPYVWLTSAPNVMVCAAFATAKLSLTLGAAAYVALPACEAWIVHVPAATMVTVVLLTVQTPVVSEEELTGRPDDAVALMANGAEP